MQNAELSGLETSNVISNRRHFMLAERHADKQAKNGAGALRTHDC